MHDQTRSEQEHTADFDRRALLSKGGVAVVAGVAGLAVAGTFTASSAEAAANAPLVLGVVNTSDAQPTSLTSTAATGPTLTVGNTGGRAPLHLTEVVTPATPAGLTSGDLANFDGDLFYTAGSPLGPLAGLVYTEFNANQLVTITPQRVLNTANAAGRANIVNAAGNLDASGRLIGGHTIQISLADLEIAAAAAYCNLTVNHPLTGGFMTLWPGGPRPATSSINFGANAVIANFAVTGTSATDTVSIYSAATTHVLLDITAFAVGSPLQVSPLIVPAATQGAVAQRLAESGLAAHAKAGTLSKFYAARR